MGGGFSLPNFSLIFAGAICLGVTPILLIAWYMLTKKVNRTKWEEHETDNKHQDNQ